MSHCSLLTVVPANTSQLLGLFGDVGLKSFLILALTALLCWGLRRSAAAARHWVWFLGVAGLLCLPVLQWVVPGTQQPLWRVGTVPGSGNEFTLTFQVMPGKAGGRPATAASSLSEAAPGAVAGSVETVGPRSLAARVRSGWGAGLLCLWLCGAAGVLFSIGAGTVAVQRLRRSGSAPVDAHWRELMERLCGELGLKRRVTLLICSEDVMPVTWGVWRPHVLLPSQAAGWSAARKRVVLMHELAHVKRWDCLTQLLGRLASAIYWFNPLVWAATRQMCVERERACDDLVLRGGSTASDYATHLVAVAQSFRRAPQMAAIGMARSSRLEGRVAAIVDASRARHPLSPWFLAACSVAVLAVVGAVAAQKTGGGETAAPPWFDARLRAYFGLKEEQARKLADDQKVPAEVWPYFKAGMQGDWATATNLWVNMRKHAHQYEGTTADETLDVVWQPILETDLAWEQFANWSEKYVLKYGNDIVRSIPAGSIYFGGTDPGRGLISAMCESQPDAKPFYTLTQNALADGTYLDYLRAMYGGRIYIASAEDSQACYSEYLKDAQQRKKENKLKPGENVREVDGKVLVNGQVAVMNINGLLAKTIFDHNPDREFYIEESFPLDWMYPYLSPHGLIMKLNRQPLTTLSDEMIRRDHEYWSRYLKPVLGGWLKEGTPVREVAAFARKAHGKHDLAGFKADPEFMRDIWAQKAFSKLRSSIAGVYDYRLKNAKTPEEKSRMSKEADYAFQQAYALCPTSPEAVFRYANFLLNAGRKADALLIAETTLELDPKNAQIESLVSQLKGYAK